MKFYKRFCGDIQSKTGHLSLAEFGAYDRLLDHYYSTEKPLPTGADDCARIARAMSKEERKAVERVLSEFFVLTEGGWVQDRAEEMISEAQPKIAAARTNGAKGGRPKGSGKHQKEKPTGLFSETQGETQTSDFEKGSQSQNQKGIGIQPHVAKELHGLNTHNAECVSTPGEICKAMKVLGIADVNPGHPDLLMLLEAGATAAEFEGAARTAVAKHRGFAYAMGVIKGTRKAAAEALKTLHTGPLPAAQTQNRQEALEAANFAAAQRFAQQGDTHEAV